MKKSSLLAASVAAASATALSYSTSATLVYNSQIHNFHEEAGSSRVDGNSSLSSRPSPSSTDQFAPRFDGLRFIETLVTGHR